MYLNSTFDLTRRFNLRGLCASMVCVSALGLSTFNAALAQSNYPNRAVKIIVPFSAGGATDMIVREVARGLQEAWGQSVVTENKAGAGGAIAAEFTARSAPDGYTLMLASESQLVVGPFLNASVPYNTLTDFKPLVLVGAVPMILVANPALKVNNFGEFLNVARTSSKSLDYASSGNGASHHMSMESLQRVANIRLNHIPYKGGAPALQDVLAGHVPVMWSGLSTAPPHIKAGKLVPLAYGSLERSSLVPSVPTVAETFSGYETGSWIGLIAPTGLPTAVAEKIERDVLKIISSPAYRERLLAAGSEVRIQGSAAFATRIKAEYARNKDVIANLGAGKK